MAALAIGGAGCSWNVGPTAENLISEHHADRIGLGPLDATCDEPEERQPGETFRCTATTSDGRVIEFQGEMLDSKSLSVITTNLLTRDEMLSMRADGARGLGENLGVTLATDDISCPDEVVVLDETGDIHCEITDSSTGRVYSMVISTGGIEPGVGVRDLQYNVIELIRIEE